MASVSSDDRTRMLQTLMQRAGIASFRALAAQAGVSRWQIDRLRQGGLSQMRLEYLTKLAAALSIPLTELLAHFGAVTPEAKPEALQADYQRLQQQLAQQAEQVRSQVQADALRLLESWLVYWPTAAAKVAELGDDFPAQRLLPLVKPVENLMAEWGVAAFGAVGEKTPYDPQRHQLISGSADPGDPVRVRNVGYCHHDKLLYRAKVSPG
ncbi:MAG: helix-turn-helix domain-containing protein [Leptolyngbya sp. SIO4C1]|nr:helix-turn-helix domain-containing protein [Leptolyngbya sp. SIO4C1]